ncbi:MAG TPA: hypothetical protein VM328_05360, partial [Fimbriimonadaceae bacterium]|nr:hypothetical protein [Fimbriimonadaceae bacterium]
RCGCGGVEADELPRVGEGSRLLGCGRPPSSASSSSAAPMSPPDPWKLICLDPAAPTPALLWNGLIGVRLNRFANGLGQSFLMIDEYETQGEEKIRPLPNPLSLVVDEASNELGVVSRVSEYRQELDMRTGILTTRWNEAIENGTATVVCETAIHPDARVLAQKWTLVADRDADFSVGPAADVEGIRWPSQIGGSAALEGLGPSEVRWAFRSRQLSGGVPNRRLTPAGQPLVVEMLWGFGHSPNWMRMRSARGVLKMGVPPLEPPTLTSYADVAEASKRIWAERWRTDIEIDGPVEDQQAVRSFMFYLQGAIHPNGGMSVSPLGLSGTTYNGHVFWDADIWVFPALALINPELARAIPEYRLDMLPRARENYREWLAAGRPTASDQVAGSIRPGFDNTPGAMFPWESSVSGRETVIGNTRHEHHVGGSVAHGLALASSLGLVPSEEADEAIEQVSVFYMNRIERRPDGLYDLKGVVSPDEHHIGDNDLYTNILAGWTIRDFFFRKRDALTADAEIPKLHLPRDGQTLLSYDNDRLRGYKQAAAVLSIYPLQHQQAEREARAMMERFESKVIKNGPAMSDSVHALIWARLGETERAYEVWRRSWREFANHPLLLFSEKRSRDVTYFTTGAGGCLQTVIYGFLGFRLDEKPQPGANWSQSLLGGKVLSIKPNLSPQWKSVKFKNFEILGKRYTLTATHDASAVVAETQGDR